MEDFVDHEDQNLKEDIAKKEEEEIASKTEPDVLIQTSEDEIQKEIPISSANGQVGLPLSQSKRHPSPKKTRQSQESLRSEQSSEDLLIGSRSRKRRPLISIDEEEDEEDQHSSQE